MLTVLSVTVRNSSNDYLQHLLFAVKKWIKLVLKDKLLSKRLLTYVGKFVLKQLDNSPSFAMSCSQLGWASLTIC